MKNSQFGVRVHVLLGHNFLKDLDERALRAGMNRSEYIRLALLHQMGRQDLVSPPETAAQSQDEGESDLVKLMRRMVD